MRTIDIKVKPRAQTNLVEPLSDGTYKVSVRALPTENQANIEMKKLLADYFEVHFNQIEIVKGWKSKRKTVRIKDL